MPSSINGSDPEKGIKATSEVQPALDVDVVEGESELVPRSGFDKVWKILSSSGVELRGVQPVPEELRTDSAFNKIFTVWCTSLLCPLP